ncbi:MAG: amino acid adenylation domain-containing protein [Bacteroidota bacterium]
MRYNFNRRCFEEQVVNPGKLAIAGSDSDISWTELEAKVTLLSAMLSDLGVVPGSPVVIYGHKEHLFPVAMLSCIHAGFTYVPVDKIYPEDRVKKILSLTGAQVLINCTEEPVSYQTAVIIDKDLLVTRNSEPTFTERSITAQDDHLQYIMFTSGSTGEPKGVQITFNSVKTFYNWASADFGFTAGDVFMNQAPFTFDVSLCDVLLSFGLGGTLVLSPTELVKDQDAFLQRLVRYGCTVWTSTPSFVFLFLRNPGFKKEKLAAFHTFLFMGEALPPRTCQQLYRQFPGARVLNAYGPTEATIVTTFVEITPEVVAKYPSLPIGYPMPGSKLLIEKGEGSENSGELIITGDHVSIGYFNNTALNEVKFTEHNGKRAFKTGDLAYYEDGMLFYLGRNDDQVKLNGFRIELDEISNVLCTSAEISDAVTLPLKRGNEVKKLVSFVILSNPDADFNVKTDLSELLSQKLPYYMIPGDIVVVEDFPYGASHKIDGKKLVEEYVGRIS